MGELESTLTPSLPYMKNRVTITVTPARSADAADQCSLVAWRAAASSDAYGSTQQTSLNGNWASRVPAQGAAANEGALEALNAGNLIA
jgi:hypothetical protein